MDRNLVPKGQRRIFGISFTELLAVLAIISFLIAVFYPVFQKVNNLPQ